jgi:hypothetical protein
MVELRGSVTVKHQAHNLKDRGSIPLFAILLIIFFSVFACKNPTPVITPDLNRSDVFTLNNRVLSDSATWVGFEYVDLAIFDTRINRVIYADSNFTYHFECPMSITIFYKVIEDRGRKYNGYVLNICEESHFIKSILK